MLNKIKLLLICFFLFAADNDLCAQNKDSCVSNAWVQNLLKEYKIPALGIGIIKDGTLRQINVFGYLKKSEPAPYNTIFNVASLTKPIVTMLTLTLVDRGAWKLDEPLSDYWTDPDVAGDPRSKTLTTRHVLTHQTGFVNWRWLHKTKKLTFDVDPGKKFGYSGEGFEYLKKALENKFHKSLTLLADSLIFKPLHMYDTKFVWDASVDERRFASWHDAAGMNSYQTTKRTDASAADDLLTTIEDYGNFAAFVINGFGLSKDIFTDMTTPHALIKKGDYMGLGWEIIPALRNKEYAILHSGSDAGVRTLIVLLPESREGLIIMTNSDNGTRLYFKLIPEFLSLGNEIIKRAN